jgi:outer membrane protein OmpA-like peptidoglycan-associated protein
MQAPKIALLDFPTKNVTSISANPILGNKKLNTLSSPFPTFSQESNKLEKTNVSKPTFDKPYTSNLYKSNTTYSTSNTIQTPNTLNASTIDMSNVMTKKEAEKLLSKKDAELLMTKNDYQNLLNEIAILKEEVKNSNRISQKNNKPIVANIAPSIGSKKVIIDTTYKSLARANNKEIQIIRDTIYIEKPVEKIVTRIVRDTVVNTIEKNNTITKVEEKTVFTNNERELILNAEPEVVLFDVGSFMIKSVYFPKLISLSNKYKKYPELKISIQGYTDNTGSVEKNKILSDNRANAVKVYLMNHGVSKNAFSIDSYGSENPLAENKTKQGKSQNRRVVVKIIE